MKKFKNAVIVGMGRALGMILLYAALMLSLKLMGLKLDLSQAPPTITGEITKTIIK